MNKVNKEIKQIAFQKADLKKEIDAKNIEIQRSDVEFTDFSNPKAEVLGRSQILSKADNLEADVNFMRNCPDEVKKANQFFDNAFNTLSGKNENMAYEKATILTNAFKEEFLEK